MYSSNVFYLFIQGLYILYKDRYWLYNNTNLGWINEDEVEVLYTSLTFSASHSNMQYSRYLETRNYNPYSQTQ